MLQQSLSLSIFFHHHYVLHRCDLHHEVAIDAKLQKNGIDGLLVMMLTDVNKTLNYQPGSYYGGYYGYRRGRYGAWGGYGHGTQTHVSNYTEGTVNVDMVDRELKRMVWEGVAVGRVNDKKTSEETRTNINAGIQEMFSGYPFRAGQ